MKKWLPKVVVVLLVLAVALIIYRHIVPTIAPSSASLSYINSLEELEERSTIIVEATVTGKGRPDEGDFPFTYTPVKVSKVHKGNVSPGEEIEVTEFYRNIRTPFGLYTQTIESYLPMKNGGKYLLFLYEEDNGLLTVVNVYIGKFVWPLPGKSAYTAKNLEIYRLESDYSAMLGAVVAKYGSGN